MHEDVDGRLTVSVAPELQHLHSLVADPALTKRLIGKLGHGDWHDRTIAERGECRKGARDIVGYELDDDIDVFRETKIPVRTDRQPAGYQIANTFGLQRGGESFKA